MCEIFSRSLLCAAVAHRCRRYIWGLAGFFFVRLFVLRSDILLVEDRTFEFCENFLLFFKTKFASVTGL